MRITQANRPRSSGAPVKSKVEPIYKQAASLPVGQAVEFTLAETGLKSLAYVRRLVGKYNRLGLSDCGVLTVSRKENVYQVYRRK